MRLIINRGSELNFLPDKVFLRSVNEGGSQHLKNPSQNSDAVIELG